MKNFILLLVILSFVFPKFVSGYEIAVVGSLTGPAARYGDDMIKGVEVAVEEQNSQGGLNGRRIEIIAYDDMGNPSEARRKADQIISSYSELIGVIGHTLTSTTLAALSVYKKFNIPLLVPSEQAPKITEEGYNNVFRFGGREDWMIKYLSVVLKKNLNWDQIAIIYSPNSRHYVDYINRFKGKHLKLVYANAFSETAIKIAKQKFTSKNSGLVVVFPFADDKSLQSRIEKIKRLLNVSFSSPYAHLLIITENSEDVPIYEKLTKEYGAFATVLSPVSPRSYSKIKNKLKKYGIHNNYSFYAYVCSKILIRAAQKKFHTQNNAKVELASLSLNEIYINAMKPTINKAYNFLEVNHKPSKMMSAQSSIMSNLRRKIFDTDVGSIKFNENGDARWAPYAVYKAFGNGSDIVRFNGTGGGGCCPDLPFCCDSINAY